MCAFEHAEISVSYKRDLSDFRLVPLSVIVKNSSKLPNLPVIAEFGNICQNIFKFDAKNKLNTTPIKCTGKNEYHPLVKNEKSAYTHIAENNLW